MTATSAITRDVGDPSPRSDDRRGKSVQHPL